MTHTELSRVIREFIQDTYNKIFIGKLKITNLDPQGYIVSLYLDNSEKPLTIMSDLPDNEFIPFIKEELRKMKLHKTEYSKLVQLQPTNYTTYPFI